MDIEAYTLGEAFEKIADTCCERYLKRAPAVPVRCRIEFYGAKILLRQETLTAEIKRRIHYTFLVIYEEDR